MTFVRLEKSLLFLVVLFLPTQLGIHFWPPFSYIYSLPVDYLSFQIYFWDLLVVLLVSVWLVGGPKLNAHSVAILLFFFLTQLVSLINAQNIGAGLVRLEQLVIVGLFGIYLASHRLNEIIGSVIVSVKLAVLFEAGLAICQFLFQRSIGLWIVGERSFDLADVMIAKFNWYGQVFLRPYATFPHPNVLAGFMVVSFLLIFFFDKKERFSLWLGGLVTILSFSRVGILVLLGEVTYALRSKLRLMIVGLLVLSPLLFVRFQSALNFDYLSILRREELAENAISFFQQAPIVGVGLNNFLNQTASSRLISGTSRFFQPVHNIFLLNLSETGLVGLVGFLLFLIVAIAKLWGERQMRVSRVFLYCWLVIIFLGSFDHYFLTLAQGQRILLLIWGLSMSGHDKIKE